MFSTIIFKSVILEKGVFSPLSRIQLSSRAVTAQSWIPCRGQTFRARTRKARPLHGMTGFSRADPWLTSQVAMLLLYFEWEAVGDEFFQILFMSNGIFSHCLCQQQCDATCIPIQSKFQHQLLQFAGSKVRSK